MGGNILFHPQYNTAVVELPSGLRYVCGCGCGGCLGMGVELTVTSPKIIL